MAKASLLAGKDVFVEKPLALRGEEGVELHELALKKEKILMVGHLLQYHPAVIGLKQLISRWGAGPDPVHLQQPAEPGQDPKGGEHPLELRPARHLGDPLPDRRDAGPGRDASGPTTSTRRSRM